MRGIIQILVLVAFAAASALAQVAGDPVLESVGDAHVWGDGAGASVSVTYDNTGTDVVVTATSGVLNVTGEIQEGSVAVVTEDFTLTGGVGIAAIGDLSTNRTVTFDATELDALTWDAGSLANFSWTYSLSGASDPVINFADGVINATTGTWQVGGVDVVLESLTLTGGNGIATLGDLSTGRTVAVELLGVVDGTGGTSNNSGLEFQGAGSDLLTLLQGCSDTEVLKWTEASSLWGCAPDAGGTNPLTIASPEELTLATGSATLAGSANTLTYHSMRTEGAAGSDDWTAVVCTAGSQHVVYAGNASEDVVVQLSSGPDFTLDSVNDRAILHCDATNSIELLSRHNAG